MASKYAFTPSLKELRFFFCQTSEHSQAARSFLTRAYPTMKKNNPHTPILLREALHVEPRVWARYGLSDKQIEETVTALVKKGGSTAKATETATERA
ncbi:MAG: hypothetical protein M1826_003414 [Phylliscum demangeonii]|nr:MAG: hypothetical protein M1826_003414 [Phylliscum demangeonii]